MMNRLNWVPLLLITLTLTNCSSTPDPTETSTQNIYSADEQIFVGDSIEMSYDHNVIMKRAESFFDKESYAEAVVEYKHFLDLHRNHILAPYAQYKIGVSHFKQFRTVDRDPEPLQKSISGFKKLLKEFPASRYEAEAKKTVRTCKEQLVQRHLMVAEFYYKREAYLAAAHRYEKIIMDFPEIESTGKAMFHLAKTYQKLGIEQWTQDWLVALIRQYPDGPYYSSAQSLLALIQEEYPTLLAALPENPPILEKHVIASPADPALSQPPSNLLFANVGHLPTTPTPEAQTVAFTEKPPALSACPMGTWCDDSQSVRPTQPTAKLEPLPTDPKACKTGEWC